MPLKFTDAATVSEPRETRNGYLVCDARIARTGIQLYRGDEMGRPDLDVVRVYRAADEVFSRDAMGSFAHQPVTNDHPDELVSADTWKDAAVGMIGDTVARDGDHVRVPFTLMDRAAISDFRAGKRELSCGYTSEIVWQGGTTPTGETYDAMQTCIVGNHLALVDRGRAGASCRIGDSWAPTPSLAPITPETHTMATRTVQVDGFSIETTDQGAQALERYQRQLSDAQTAITSRDGQIAALTSAHAGAIAAKDGEIAALGTAHTAALAAKDGEIAALTARIPDAAALDALTEARSGVISVARRTLGDTFDAKGKSVADIQALVVTKRLGDAAVAGKAPEFIAAAFDTLALADAGSPRRDPIRDTLATRPPPVPVGDAEAAADAAYDDHVQRLRDGWKTPNKEVV